MSFVSSESREEEGETSRGETFLRGEEYVVEWNLRKAKGSVEDAEGRGDFFDAFYLGCVAGIKKDMTNIMGAEIESNWEKTEAQVNDALSKPYEPDNFLAS